MSSHHGPYVLGYTRATMAGTERSEAGRRSGPQKACPSTDWGLQPGPMKLESLVIHLLSTTGKGKPAGISQPAGTENTQSAREGKRLPMKGFQA